MPMCSEKEIVDSRPIRIDDIIAFLTKDSSVYFSAVIVGGWLY